MSEEAGKTAIKLEKAMLEVLGRSWTPAGISVETLVYELIDEVKRLRQENEQLKAADRDHLAAKNGMEKRLTAEIDRLVSENRRLRELPESPGPRYTAGEYSRRNHQAMIDDLMDEQEAGRLRQERGTGL